MKSLFQRSRFQNIAVLTPLVRSLTRNWVKKGQNLYFMYQWYRKRKASSKGKSKVMYSKPLSQNFEVLTSRGDVTNPKMGQKGPNLSCTNVYRNMKTKNKRYFEVNDLFMKLFSRNREIFYPYIIICT